MTYMSLVFTKFDLHLRIVSKKYFYFYCVWLVNELFEWHGHIIGFVWTMHVSKRIGNTQYYTYYFIGNNANLYIYKYNNI